MYMQGRGHRNRHGKDTAIDLKIDMDMNLDMDTDMNLEMDMDMDTETDMDKDMDTKHRVLIMTLSHDTSQRFGCRIL